MPPSACERVAKDTSTVLYFAPSCSNCLTMFRMWPWSSASVALEHSEHANGRPTHTMASTYAASTRVDVHALCIIESKASSVDAI